MSHHSAVKTRQGNRRSRSLDYPVPTGPCNPRSYYLLLSIGISHVSHDSAVKTRRDRRSRSLEYPVPTAPCTPHPHHGRQPRTGAALRWHLAARHGHPRWRHLTVWLAVGLHRRVHALLLRWRRHRAAQADPLTHDLDTSGASPDRYGLVA